MPSRAGRAAPPLGQRDLAASTAAAEPVAGLSAATIARAAASVARAVTATASACGGGLLAASSFHESFASPSGLDLARADRAGTGTGRGTSLEQGYEVEAVGQSRALSQRTKLNDEKLSWHKADLAYGAFQGGHAPSN